MTAVYFANDCNPYASRPIVEAWRRVPRPPRAGAFADVDVGQLRGASSQSHAILS
jgi:hypothetical protein